MSRGSAIIAILIAFVGGLAIGHLTGKGAGGGEEVADLELDDSSRSAAAEAAGDVERIRVPVDTEKQPVKGPENALVTIVEFSDFECPFCSRVVGTMDQIKEQYGDKVRIVWRNNPLPFHKNALPAAIASMEAYEQGGDEKFWKMHDLLFENQKALGRDDLEGYAKQVGLDMGDFRKALDNKEHEDLIKADQKLAKDVDAGGTPHFFVNGRRVKGAKPFSAFKEIIDDEVKRAEQMVQAGVPKSKVYSQFMDNAGKGGDGPDKQPEQAKKKRQPDPDAVYNVPVPDKAPSHGPKNALVTIVEFSDFQCPFCSRVEPTMDKVKEKYGNDVRVVWLNNPLPFHDQAMPAAIAATEAFEQGGNKKFWKMHELLFDNQKQLSRDKIVELGKKAGLNVAKLKRALDEEKYKDRIKEEQKLARSRGATGTPGFFINGRNLRGAQPLQKFTAVIDEELKKAKKMVEDGTPRSQLYSKIIEKGATSPQFIEQEGGGGGGDRGGAKNAKKYEIPVPSDVPGKGAKNAKVVIQEFSDFQCPFCSRVNPTINKIMEEYGDKVRVVWRNYPLPMHPDAPLAHQAAMEVHRQGGDDKFWKYHDLLFANQKKLKRDDLEQYAKQVGGINLGQFRKALDSGRHEDALERDKKAIQKAGARIGTPSFFIDGELLQGAQPFEKFKATIDAALNS